MRRAHGFTLLEILIAMAVLALALLATVRAASSFAGNQAYLQERTLAEWVARNRLVELQLEDKWPATGRDKDKVRFAGPTTPCVAGNRYAAIEDSKGRLLGVLPVDADGKPIDGLGKNCTRRFRCI